MWDVLGQGLTLAATAGVIAAIFNQGIVLLKERSARHRSARQLALEISLSLDLFVDDTLDFRAEILDAISQKNDLGNFSFAPPKFQQPVGRSEDWHSLDHKLSRDVYDFSRDVQRAYRKIAYESWNMIPPEIGREYSDTALVLASQAQNLSLLSRFKYGLAQEFILDDFLANDDLAADLRRDADIVQNRRRAKLDSNPEVGAEKL